jgi:hypothetical protein
MKAKGELYGMRFQSVKIYGSDNWVMKVKDMQCLESSCGLWLFKGPSTQHRSLEPGIR